MLIQALLGGALAGSLAMTPVAWAQPHAPTPLTCQEDGSGPPGCRPWSCVDNGNRICGPGNPEGKLAACYDDARMVVALWPCHVVINPDGSSDVYRGVSDWSRPTEGYQTLDPDPDEGVYSRGYAN